MSGRLKSSSVEVKNLEELYDLFMERGWGDGLPILPPTEDRIEGMLQAVDLPPDKVIGEIPPLSSPATVEKIAINAVMAGCRPEYFPAVIAVVEAALETPFNLPSVQTTTNPAAPMIVLNGPVRDQIKLNCQAGCFGPGWRANATIGRALRLIMLTLGGATPGPVAKATFGLPARYTFCFGEDEEHTPWTPLHVERGFAKDVSTVTLLPVDILFQATIGGGLDDGGKRLAEVAGLVLSRSGHPATIFHTAQPCIVIPAVTARMLASQGTSKEALKKMVFQQSRILASELPEFQIYKRGGAPEHHTIDGYVQPCGSERDVMIVVAGGDMPSYVTIMPSFYEGYSVTKEIKYARAHTAG